ncbi:uncharacterized protein LOC144546042 isoform X3 [Carex rostrata]
MGTCHLMPGDRNFQEKYYKITCTLMPGDREREAHDPSEMFLIGTAKGLSSLSILKSEGFVIHFWEKRNRESISDGASTQSILSISAPLPTGASTQMK